jgi:predicted membrane-bound dolichyl-phosphate-mannose-protein mannosyltransferase
MYMLHFVRVPALDSIPRLIFRSRHLFLLASAVANLAMASDEPTRVTQKVASVLILIAPFSLLTAFFIDADRGMNGSPAFHLPLYGLFVAGFLLAISNRPGNRTTD